MKNLRQSSQQYPYIFMQKAKLGLCAFFRHRSDINPNANPDHEGRRRRTAVEADEANQESRDLLGHDNHSIASPWSNGGFMAH